MEHQIPWPETNKDWTLFLDRDGVINERLPGDYVRTPDGFTFLPGVLKAIADLSLVFGRLIVVTNQQGIGKGLMSEDDLAAVHRYMLAEAGHAGGKIDAVYYCPHLAGSGCNCRKPATGMFEQASTDFPDIDPLRSVMAGDTPSDMEFGLNNGMFCVAVGNNNEAAILADVVVPDLAGLSHALLKKGEAR